MNKILCKVGLGLCISGMAVPVLAQVTFGNPESDLGAITLSGTLRANYQDKDYGETVSNDRKIKFDTGIFRLGYESPDWFGKAEYRCYQYNTLCDFSTLVYGYAGYRINPTDNVTVGLIPIAFGPGRFWDSSFYAGINNTMGLQDAQNLGMNYHFELPSDTKLDLAYFATDGGKYKGDSKDAARYTANLIDSADPTKTNLQEKNMWMAKVQQDLDFLKSENMNVSIGGSYWYSDIENKKTGNDGNRKAWALFSQIGIKDFGMTLTGGEQSINNGDIANPHTSTFGSFDGEYDIANKGYFYTIDTHYTFKNVNNSINITPYFVYSGYDKNNKDFKDSERHIVGIVWDYKNTSLYTEYVMSKNDPFVGGNGNSLAQGDDSKWNKLLNFTFIYNF